MHPAHTQLLSLSRLPVLLWVCRYFFSFFLCVSGQQSLYSILSVYFPNVLSTIFLLSLSFFHYFAIGSTQIFIISADVLISLFVSADVLTSLIVSADVLISLIISADVLIFIISSAGVLIFLIVSADALISLIILADVLTSLSVSADVPISLIVSADVLISVTSINLNLSIRMLWPVFCMLAKILPVK